MLDHSGTRRERYEDTFRAIGNYLDAHRFTQIVMVETSEGFLIKGYTVPEGQVSSDTMYVVPQTYLFSNEDIDALIEQAYRRRKSSR